MTKVSVIIVSYNSSQVLGPCLESLRAQSFSPQIEAIVVDNASWDGSADFVARAFPEARLIKNSANVGYSKGVNIGIREAKGDYLLILNPDTVLEEGAIEKMVDFMDRNQDAGIVGPKLVFLDGNIQYSCRRFYTFKVLLLRRTFVGKIFKDSGAVRSHLMMDYDHETLREVDWVLGACMLVRKKAVESVGLMDERFFLYFEDVDWCYRMKQKGWKVYYYPDAVISHGYARESAQSVVNRSFIAHLASLIRYYEKWNFLLYFAKKYREVAKVILFLALDLFAFNLAFLSAYYLRVHLHEIFTNPIFPVAVYKRFIFFENLLFVFTYFAVSLYRIRRETSYVDELFKIARAIVLASVLLMASTYLSQIRVYSRLVVAFLVPFAVLYDWALRSWARMIHRKLLALKIDLKRVVVIGPRREAQRLEQKLVLEDSVGYDVVGMIPTDGEPGSGLGSIDELDDIVERYRVQEILIMHGAVPPDHLVELISFARKNVLDVTVFTDYSELVIQKAEVGNLLGKPVIAYRRDTRYKLDMLTKRATDILLGGALLVLSLPFFIVYWSLQKVRGKTPFRVQARLGRNGRPLLLPVTGTGPAERIHRGPSDLVNLPLFFKVIRGELSIVGPYPIPVEDSARLDKRHRFRFDVRPGVTGYWRLGPARGVGLEDLMAQDAGYIRDWSLPVDLKIFVRSIGRILSGTNRTLEITT